MAGDGFMVDVSTIENYLTALMDSFILYKVCRYDIRGKQFLQTNDKYYVADIGLRQYLLGADNKKDTGHILENVVYLELLGRGYRVYVGKVGIWEVDFVAEKADEKIYFQVCETMSGEETREREFRPFKSIKDSYRRMVLTMDYVTLGNYEGIEVINIVEWLLG
ncbi:hypothetical protein FACS1894152_8330 [Bacilli bacterium]|nr:hypothetical protein FACS1894152_8330 [Bacilli bacterium]